MVMCQLSSTESRCSQIYSMYLPDKKTSEKHNTESEITCIYLQDKH